MGLLQICLQTAINRGKTSAATISLSLVLSATTMADARAHTSDRGVLMLLPTEYYLIGGAIAVALTFAVLGFMPARGLGRMFKRGAAVPAHALPPPDNGWRHALSGMSFLIFTLLIYAGFAGSGDPLANPLPLTIWTLGWVGLPLAHALLGNLWNWINPWSGPYRLLSAALRLGDSQDPPFTLPKRLGYLPAIAGFFAFGWFELVDLAPDGPTRLAWAAGLYWTINFAAMLAFGEAEWRSRGECFSVFFRFVSLLSPIGRNDAGRIVLSIPGARVLAKPPLPLSAVLFILLALATVSFDGLNKTFWYLDLIGINPLAFPGRSAVVWPNTFGLLGMFGAMAGLFCLCTAAGARVAGAKAPWAGLGCLVLSLLPISLAYHFSHYLTVLLVNLQYALAAASDPLGSGLDLLGLGNFHVTTSFLTDHRAVKMIWNIVAGAIVICHLWAVILSHAIAIRVHGTPRRAAISQAPLAALMVAYTVFGLWLLSTPTGA
jgi:hypothetical protein